MTVKKAMELRDSPEALREYLSEDGTILCANTDERHILLEVIRETGIYEIGFNEEFASNKWLLVYDHCGYIHAGMYPDCLRDRVCTRFDELFDESCADSQEPLQPLNELYSWMKG